VAVALAACAAVVASIVTVNRGNPGAAPVASDTSAGAGRTSAQPASGPSAAQPGPAVGSAGAADVPSRPEVEAQVKSVIGQTEQLDRTVFAKEVEAQKYEEYFIRLWDDFRAAEDKLALLEGAAFQTLAFAGPGTPASHDWDVKVTKHDGPRQSLDAAGWRGLVKRLREAGYRATEIEFHQSEFVHDPGHPARSTVSTLVHLVNDAAASRQVVRAKLKVEWSDQPDRPGEGGMFVPRTIDVTDLVVMERVGDVAFEPVALPGGKPEGLFLPGAPSGFVLAYDLDGDGRSEILVPGENMLLRNKGGWRFEREEVLPGSLLGELSAGLIADFTADGLPDLLCIKNDRLFLLRGIEGGRFSSSPPEQVVSLEFPAQAVAALTAGDIDGDGDLDAWFGQYKPPYIGGQMPTPYYDANDGHPAALLVNDGTGRFEDRTEAAGLAAKRHRRTFAASFVDLDGDRDLDLLVNSDFAGLDIYYNDGGGNFTDVTDRVVDERHNFGMGHTFADFNLDGRLDVYTIGMSSTTARRLTAMGAGREEFPEHQAKRPQMGYGNRMFLAPAPGASGGAVRYAQPAYRDDIARTGWSWGASAPDFDNDGDPDIFVANGHKSGTTCRDYCTTYWRRDIYLGNSKEDTVMKNLFLDHGIPKEMSWNGFEHDVLYMNEGGQGFINVAHLMGVAFEFDGRNVITDDFDGDGRMDLVVLEKRLPGEGRYLHVLKNNWPTPFNWVGVRLAETRPGFSPIGAEVRVRSARGQQVGRIVTGDSIHSQHANVKHFGIGTDDKVEWIEVTWPNGQTTRVDNPDVNRWHALRPVPATADAR
jgi:hypothetical protein